MEKLREIFENRRKRRIFLSVLSVILFCGFLVLSGYINKNQKEAEKVYEPQPITQFINVLKSDDVKKISDVHISESNNTIKYTYGTDNYEVEYPTGFLVQYQPFLDRIALSGSDVTMDKPAGSWLDYLFPIFMIAILLYLGFTVSSKVRVATGSQEEEEVKGEKTTFKDIAGYRYVVDELREVVEFLTNPERFSKYTDKLIRGVLLEGPPGNGKTLLAKAVAGESETPFFQVSGSDLEGMYIGSGAMKINALFKKVRKAADKYGKAILFIDEIDAIGVNREARTVVETNQTINKLLTEMDGFNKEQKIVIIGATNYAKSLDPALTRSGRFDRIITVPRPNLKDRELVIRLYLSKKGDLIDKEIDSLNYAYTLAQQTEGFCNADIDKLINEASIVAKRKEKEFVDIECLREAFTKTIAGVQTDNTVTEEDKKIVAYHEAGHAVAQIMTSKLGYKSVAYITITPYGQSLGHVSPVSENKLLLKKSDLENEIKVILAGRAVEDKILEGDFTTGALSDLQQANRILLNYVAKYGMSDKISNFFVEKIDESNELIQEEIRLIRDRIYKSTQELIENNYDIVEKIAEHLLRYETIDQQELPDILKETSYTSEEVSEEVDVPIEV